MSFGRFLDFVTRGLAVPKASCFEDKWEGLVFYSNLGKFSTADGAFKWNAPIEWIYVSCWHAETEECDAMWKLYGRSDTAVAIETSVEKLEKVLVKENLNTLIQSAAVSYKPPGSDCRDVALTRLSGNANQSCRWIDVNSLFYKHGAFRFESEFRFAIVDSEVVDVGDMRNLPLHNPRKLMFLASTKDSNFLDRVTVSPSAPSAMVDIIKTTLDMHGLKAPVVKSSLAM